jgi:type III pantothenate kinase
VLLTINQGNTRTKAMIVGTDTQEHYVTATDASVQHYRHWLSMLPRPRRVLLSSVVPNAAAALCQAAEQLLGVRVEQIEARTDLGIRFTTVDYHQLGADLFVNAVASHHCYGGNLLNVDLGSASTFCVIKDGLYLGTSIVPGMELSIRAMISGTALLKEFTLTKMERVINDNTIACLQSGIYFGYFELVRGMIQRVQAEHGPLTVVLTGGIGSFLHEELAPYVHHFRPHLTLDGLRLIAELIS